MEKHSEGLTLAKLAKCIRSVKYSLNPIKSPLEYLRSVLDISNI